MFPSPKEESKQLEGKRKKKKKSEVGRVRETQPAGMQVCFAPAAGSFACLLADIIPSDADNVQRTVEITTFGEPLSTEKAVVNAAGFGAR